MLGTGEKQEKVSRVGLTAADLASAGRREPAAVARVYNAHAPFVLRYLLAAVGDRPTAEDLTGEVFKRAVDGLPGFGGPVEALGGWLFRFARQSLSDFRRGQARSPDAASLGDAPDRAVPAAGVEDPEPVAVGRVEGDRMLAALRRLSAEQQEVLLLYMAAGLTVPEVAAVVGRTSGEVSSLRYRGLASLAGVLGVTRTSSPGSSEPARPTGLVEPA